MTTPLNYNELIIRTLHEELSKHTKLELRLHIWQYNNANYIRDEHAIFEIDILDYNVRVLTRTHGIKHEIPIYEPNLINQLITIMKTVEQQWNYIPK